MKILLTVGVIEIKKKIDNNTDNGVAMSMNTVHEMSNCHMFALFMFAFNE